MRKLFLYLIAVVGLSATLVACNDDNDNPGDFGMTCTLDVLPIQSLSHPDQVYDLNVKFERDTNYLYKAAVKDTVFGPDGQPQIGSDGKIMVNVDTVYYRSKITARYVEFDTIFLPAKADTFHVEVRSNARWYAPTPDPGTKAVWFRNFTGNGGSTTGGGDSFFEFNVSKNRAKRRPNLARQYVHTSDSTVMYMIPIQQTNAPD